MNRRRFAILLTVLAVICLSIGAGVVYHVRLKRAVEHFHSELVATGNKLTIEELVPRSDPQSSEATTTLYIAMSQLSGIPAELQPGPMRMVAPGRAIAVWQQPILPTDKSTNIWPQLRSSLDAQTNALAAACKALDNGTVRFNLNYSAGPNMTLPHLGPMKRLSQTLGAAMVVDLHEGQPSAAWEHLRATLRLNSAYEPEPIMISHLVRFAITSLAWGFTWEALQYGTWTDEQLTELQNAWAGAECLKGIDTVFAMERAFGQITLRQLRKSQTAWIQFDCDWGNGSASISGELLEDTTQVMHQFTRRYLGYWPWRWWDSYEEELFLGHGNQAGIEAARSLQGHNPYANAYPPMKVSIRALKESYPNASARFVLSDWQDIGEKFLSRAIIAQAQREMMIAGIALHRYRRQHGDWPTALNQLVPDFLEAQPLDPIDGMPLRYRKPAIEGKPAGAEIPHGDFVLYSIGQDMEDNGGDATCRSRKPNIWAGKDWVWPQPASTAEGAAHLQKQWDQRPLISRPEQRAQKRVFLD